MQIVLNGRTVEAPDVGTVAALLESLALGSKKVAVEVNGEIVPRSRWNDFRLSLGDRAEIVRAIGGG
jgi:sulfur carrier protein